MVPEQRLCQFQHGQDQTCPGFDNDGPNQDEALLYQGIYLYILQEPLPLDHTVLFADIEKPEFHIQARLRYYSSWSPHNGE